MTLAAPLNRPQSPQPARAAHSTIGSRTYEVVSLAQDRSIRIDQHSAPALALFDAAFSAFTHGSLTQTTQGEVAIEDLQPGDQVLSKSGEALDVIWIGSTTFVPADAGSRTPLTRIMADTFGLERPASFLTLGPGARLLQQPVEQRAEADGVPRLTPARAFVDGVNVIEITPPTPIRLFHLCLSRHAIINVGGLEVETFHPGAQSMRNISPSVRDLFLSFFPHINDPTDFGPLAYQHAADSRA